MKYTILLASLLLSGCGMEVKVDPVKVDPITVTHKFTFDLDQVFNYCGIQCNSPGLTPDQVQACTSSCASNFVHFFSQGIPTSAP